MKQIRLNRREFIRASLLASGGLLISLSAPDLAHAEPGAGEGVEDKSWQPSAFIELAPDGSITVYIPTPEMGQGIRTALAQIVASQLAADWNDIRVVQAPAGSQFGGMTAAGSNSVVTYWPVFRRAGAIARTLLIQAAADRWSVPVEDCVARNGEVHHPASGRSLPFAELLDAAAKLPVPESPVLLSEDGDSLVGKPLRTPDAEAVVVGSAVYGLDAVLPGMKYAAVARPPARGMRLNTYSENAAMAVPGVERVFRLQPWLDEGFGYGEVLGGLVVIAQDSWAALRGCRALEVQWESDQDSIEPDSDIFRKRFASRLDSAADAIVRGAVDAASEPGSGKVFSADYELPALAHLCMEPMNYTAHARQDGCLALGPTQTPRGMQQAIAQALGMAVDAVEVRTTLQGGGFGRRLAFDYGVEAALISRAAGNIPVKVVWSREDDLVHGFFRTPSAHRVAAEVDASGNITSWRHHVVTTSLSDTIMGGSSTSPETYEVQGAADMPYLVGDAQVSYSNVPSAVRTGSWRSVSHSFNVFVVSSFIDEIASALALDPLDYLRSLIGDPTQRELTLALRGSRGSPSWDAGRLRTVLDEAASKAGWSNEPLPAGRGRGIACCYFKQSYAAHVAEVAVDADGTVNVERLVVALDCGLAINPNGLRAQAEGAAFDGIATVLDWGTDFSAGRPRATSLNGAGLRRPSPLPRIDVHIIEGDVTPSGAGEPPYPSVAPAVANAIYAATGKRIRRLPYSQMGPG